MKYNLKILLGLVLILFCASLFAKNNVIIVQSNQPTFTVQLKSNRTTGYSWSLKKYDKKFIKVISHDYISPNTPLVGAPGYETWIFQANPAFFQNIKETRITMSYVRPWETKATGTTIVYTILPKKN